MCVYLVPRPISRHTLRSIRVYHSLCILLSPMYILFSFFGGNFFSTSAFNLRSRKGRNTPCKRSTSLVSSSLLWLNQASKSCGKSDGACVYVQECACHVFLIVVYVCVCVCVCAHNGECTCEILYLDAKGNQNDTSSQPLILLHTPHMIPQYLLLHQKSIL